MIVSRETWPGRLSHKFSDALSRLSMVLYVSRETLEGDYSCFQIKPLSLRARVAASDGDSRSVLLNRALTCWYTMPVPVRGQKKLLLKSASRVDVPIWPRLICAKLTTWPGWYRKHMPGWGLSISGLIMLVRVPIALKHVG